MLRARQLLPLGLLAPILIAGTARRADDLDWFIQSEMAKRQIPGLSLAIIEGGKIVEARAYGVIEKGGATPVTPATLFQAGSISKPVAAAGALHLVETGRLPLDGNVNAVLTSWKVPDNAFTANRPVTLRGILSHTAGLTVHGFPGYAVGTPVATLVQVLDGTGPANTAPIRVDTFPGTIWRYSGGGYTVMQQMIVDLTQRPFPDFMRETVLEPFGMRSSSYEQPLPGAKAALTASGHYPNGIVKGRWHVYPEMAAAGLWTTPSDLARFAIGIQQALAGESRGVISQAMVRQMTTEQMNGMGLGLALRGGGRARFFGHNGRDEGFDAMLTASAETGQGLVVMINANDNSRMVVRITRFIAQKYHWPDSTSAAPPVVRSGVVTPTMLRAAAGRYEFRSNNMMTLAPNDSGLSMLSDGLPDEEFIPVGDDRFASRQWNVRFTLARDASGVITGLRWTQNGAERIIPRVGPLIASLERQPDPDPGFTAKVLATLKALGQGGDAVSQSPSLTPGARRDFSGGWGNVLHGMRDLSFIAAESVAGRGIVRHEGPVARISYYSLTTETGKHYLMVHLTAEGAITDFDLVDN